MFKELKKSISWKVQEQQKENINKEKGIIKKKRKQTKILKLKDVITEVRIISEKYNSRTELEEERIYTLGQVNWYCLVWGT